MLSHSEFTNHSPQGREIIQISQTENGSVVSMRELYEFLEVKTPFTHWCKRMFKYGFEENLDFLSFLAESTGGRPETDYAITLDMAKEVSMLQRTEKGRQARRYFVSVEKIAVNELKDLSSRVEVLEQNLKPKVAYLPENEPDYIEFMQNYIHKHKVEFLTNLIKKNPDAYEIDNAPLIYDFYRSNYKKLAHTICQSLNLPYFENHSDNRFDKVPKVVADAINMLDNWVNQFIPQKGGDLK